MLELVVIYIISLISDMNNIIKDESLLSSLSNISVLIKPNEGSSIFNFSMLQGNYEGDQSQKLC